MAVWTVWEHEKFDDPAFKAHFVRDAFSWWASILGPLWALLQGMPLVFVAFTILEMGLIGLAQVTLGEEAAMWAWLLFSIWFGFEARALKRWALARRGWTMTAVVKAKRLEQAERRYFAGRDDIPPDILPSGPTTPSAPLPPAPSGPGTDPAAGPWGAPIIGVMPEGVR
ncbi:hypothetical protein DLJ53_02735 [Acuticoccus sediminis]|uniref:DUF2628 domain-containing protein n=1 Tax=Acuticoccus sediminis TaxID=2184697 RepID=A0A8B2P2S7_9HYPH|nr:DUF2628 domain-containing protein [Acuticoccus sediminis]RAI03442.1 hypothetical protein DLJ53_02735 [Acuticoccus sediminis]